VKGKGYARLAQRGQALVFVTIVMLVVLLALVTMYSMGQLTTEKMRLQNTADAAAYSSALAQARDYNFTAYTNRAMVANQVVIAQLVGLTSWARNYNDTFQTLTPQVEWMAQGIVGRFMWSLPIRGLRPAARTFNRALDSGGPIIVKALYFLIDALGYAQTVYHYGTALTVAQTLGAEQKLITFLASPFGAGFDATGLATFISNILSFGNNYNVIKMNDPDARLSDIGLFGWAYNTYQWLDFTNEKDPTLPKGGSTTSNKAKDGDNSERFAKVTTSSMDGFYDVRTRPWVPFPWPLPSALIDPTFIIGMPRVYGFTMLLFHTGGTELRNNNKTWSAQDSTAFFGLVTVPIFIPPFGPFINIPIIPWIIPPLGGPAGGAAQAGESSPINPVNNFNRDDPANYKAMSDAYGQSFSGAAFPSFGLAARMQQGKGAGSTMGQLPSGTKGGLRKYRDVKAIGAVDDPNPGDNQDITSPAIVVEIEKPSNLVRTAATGALRIGRAGSTDATSFCGNSIVGTPSRLAPDVTSVSATGNLDVGDGTANGCIRALSKAEAYFSRPSDIFKRDDNKTEYGSLYSPYWQARLVPNSLAEQGAALLYQGLGTSFSSWLGTTF
jgi:hypothetical protein